MFNKTMGKPLSGVFSVVIAMISTEKTLQYTISAFAYSTMVKTIVYIWEWFPLKKIKTLLQLEVA